MAQTEDGDYEVRSGRHTFFVSRWEDDEVRLYVDTRQFTTAFHITNDAARELAAALLAIVADEKVTL